MSPPEQIRYEKKESKSIPLTHKYMTALFSGFVQALKKARLNQFVLWDQTSPLIEVMRSCKFFPYPSIMDTTHKCYFIQQSVNYENSLPLLFYSLCFRHEFYIKGTALYFVNLDGNLVMQMTCYWPTFFSYGLPLPCNIM